MSSDHAQCEARESDTRLSQVTRKFGEVKTGHVRSDQSDQFEVSL